MVESVQDVIGTTLINNVSYEPKLPKLIVEKCTECMRCANICPYFAIDMFDQITFNPNKYFGCDLCIKKCPTKAIY